VDLLDRDEWRVFEIAFFKFFHSFKVCQNERFGSKTTPALVTSNRINVDVRWTNRRPTIVENLARAVFGKEYIVVENIN